MEHRDTFTGRYAEQLNDLTWHANRWEQVGAVKGAEACRQARWTYWDAQIKGRDMPEAT